MRAIQPPPDAVQGMWMAFGALRNIPTLAIRGALSDLLSVQTLDRMPREEHGLQCVTVPNRGHVPQLDEPQSVAALDRFLALQKSRLLPGVVERASAAFDQKTSGAAMSFKDHFSGHASAYARYRPEYPPELFAYLASLTRRREVALDCATGSGQAAIGLADHFALVVASDGSVSQLQNAQQHPHVAYIGNLAERPALQSGSVDLVVAAQAAHWFDHEKFYPEVRRVLRIGGAIALWTYGLAYVEPQIDAIVRHFYDEVIGAYWPPERRWVESGYRDLPFPWQEVAAPAFQLRLQWDLDSLIGYLGTWSAVQRYTRATGEDPLPTLRAEIAPYWPSPVQSKPVTWPLYLRAGRA